jgi:DUF1365 family protein
LSWEVDEVMMARRRITDTSGIAEPQGGVEALKMFRLCLNPLFKPLEITFNFGILQSFLPVVGKIRQQNSCNFLPSYYNARVT